ncbi:Sen15p [Lachancea thermotolerans CBS 6340]|uniref:KLTH0B04422p n=1 Tax=Lachancea thermotolerans (strain ATCC 56472 / CBS 6340 / NRRL Y-8284) TaxID=559295 RepID=C5DCN0_LACTC|nr:KLTH0B04422p [Lachancea thermotolerans CBS 6340]CAR21541.1 KLTH0B04422p [Lachancea thermotolerans CBS 6340]
MDNQHIIKLVRNNLVHQQLWDDVEEAKLEDTDAWVLRGLPPHKLSNDDPQLDHEWILPIELSQYKPGKLTLELMDKIFSELKCRRVTLGIVNDDGTVVYYFIYKGLHKPKRN